MGVEIERKFLIRGDAWRECVIRGDAWRECVSSSQEIRQGYLAEASRSSVRVRIQGDSANLNIKSAESGLSRREYEYAIPRVDADEMLASLCLPGVIHKHRHHVTHAGYLWEIDEFHGRNKGLLVAEVELESVDAQFDKPDWLGREITDCHRYYNHALSSCPYEEWRTEERLTP